MRITADNLKEIINKYKDLLLNKRISEIVLVNSRLFLFYFKKDKNQLIVDLDNSNPHIGIIESHYDELSLPSEFISKALQKGHPLIEDISLINNDRIIKITTSSTDIYYHKNKYYLYIELINAHANMILTDENNKIIVGFYETNINAPRPIVKNLTYILPEKKNEDYQNNVFSIKDYEEYVNKSFLLSLEKRKKELYGPFIKKYEKKEKSLLKKINKIKLDNLNAKESDKYKEYAEDILMNISNIKRGDNMFNNIKLDPSKSPIENANIYFNKYKKSKRTIETTTQIINNLNKELDETSYMLELIKYSPEETLKSLFNKEQNKGKKENEVHAYLPYYINYKNVTYYYGHNALENDYLTFKMFRRNSKVTWMHIKDKASAHLIINKINPSNEELDIASSLILLINKLSTGEIMYTSRENITRGDSLAKANILNYKSINMKKINSVAIDLIKRERRVK